MSRKDYVEAARIIRETAMPADARAALVTRFSSMFADANARFSPSRFRAACEVHASCETNGNGSGDHPRGQTVHYLDNPGNLQHLQEGGRS